VLCEGLSDDPPLRRALLEGVTPIGLALSQPMLRALMRAKDPATVRAEDQCRVGWMAEALGDGRSPQSKPVLGLQQLAYRQSGRSNARGRVGLIHAPSIVLGTVRRPARSLTPRLTQQRF
jgi:hypothetical protein